VQEYLDKLRTTMDAVEDDVYATRQQQQEAFEKLVMQEQAIATELGDMEEQLNAWMRGETSRPGTAAGLRGRDESSPIVSKIGTMLQSPQLPPEVLAVERLLAEEGGATGGWDTRDHDRFLRYRTQHKGQREVYCAKTAADLPDHDIESVRQHDRWFDHYQALLQRKREAIRSWRSSRAPGISPEKPMPSTPGADESPARTRPATAPLAGRFAQAAREEEKQRVREWREAKAAHEAEQAAAAERARSEEVEFCPTLMIRPRTPPA